MNKDDGNASVEKDEIALLAEIEPAVAQLLDRHLAVAKEWFPHEYIPYSLGRDYDKAPWTPDRALSAGPSTTSASARYAARGSETARREGKDTR